MKRIFRTFIVMVLCAIVTSMSITDTRMAYAAEKKTPVKVTFKNKTIKLSGDINNTPRPKKNMLKKLKKKFGKSNYILSPWMELSDTYNWKDGKSWVEYSVARTEEGLRGPRAQIRCDFYNEGEGAIGIEVGMKESKAKKIMKKLGGKVYEYGSGDVEINDCALVYMARDGKVSSVHLVYGYR